MSFFRKMNSIVNCRDFPSSGICKSNPKALCNPFMKLVENGRIPVKKCYNCLEKCNPGQVPYCITKALIDAVEGDVENGLMFCGANVGRIDKITSVHELMQELAEG